MKIKLPPFEFGILRILDCGFNLEELYNPEEPMKIGYGMSFLFDVHNNWIQYNIRVDFTDPKTDNTILTGTVLTRFSVRNLSGFVDENEKVIFPNGTLESLFGIAFSHLRAILSKNTTGSRFSNIYVPVINPTQLFNELLQNNIEKFKERAVMNDADIEIDKGENFERVSTPRKKILSVKPSIETQIQESKKSLKKLHDMSKENSLTLKNSKKKTNF